MTNPNNAIGTNAAYGMRTSVNAFNDIAQLVDGRGIVNGWACLPKSGMTVQVGGVAGTKDVAVAEDNLGNRITINNRSNSPVDVAIAAASASANRYDAIVAYVNNPAQAADETPDAPSVCGIIDVQGGTTGVSEAQIRAAITADGGTGSVAYYVVLATVYIASGTTAITSGNISQEFVGLSASNMMDISSSFTKAANITGTVKLYKSRSKLVVLCLDIGRTGGFTTTYSDIGTLPAGTLPPFTLQFPVRLFSAGSGLPDSQSAKIRVNYSTGKIDTLASAAANNHGIYGTYVWVAV